MARVDPDRHPSLQRILDAAVTMPDPNLGIMSAEEAREALGWPIAPKVDFVSVEPGPVVSVNDDPRTRWVCSTCGTPVRIDVEMIREPEEDLVVSDPTKQWAKGELKIRLTFKCKGGCKEVLSICQAHCYIDSFTKQQNLAKAAMERERKRRLDRFEASRSDLTGFFFGEADDEDEA